MTLAKLRAVQKALAKLIKIEWRLYSKEEAELDGRFDPPCAFLSSPRNTIALCVDGECYVDSEYSEAVRQLDMTKTPKEIAKKIQAIAEDLL